MARPALLRGAVLIRDSGDVIPVKRAGKGVFSVASSRGGATRYYVSLLSTPPTCSCPWFSNPYNESGTCKHIEATHLAVRANSGLGGALPWA